MQFMYEIERKDYSDFSSGRVLHSAPETTAFPVRLTSELIYRCRSYLNKNKKLTIYDPCCGGAHVLTIAGFLHGEAFSRVYGSDVNDKVIETANLNLSLLTKQGLERREHQLEADYQAYQKTSHYDALKSVERLKQVKMEQNSDVEKAEAFVCDITSKEHVAVSDVNIVIADLPYGQMVSWQGEGSNPVEDMLSNVYKVLDLQDSIVAIISEKQEKIHHHLFQQVKKMKHGKRQIVFLKPII